MAKKRKASTKEPSAPGYAELDPRDSRKRIRTFEDVADSDDEFHLNQDEVRLAESSDVKRQRRWQEKEEFLENSDEEVLGYSEEDDDLEEDDSFATAIGEPHDASGGVDADAGDDEEEEEAGLRWGTSKDDMYGADEIETEEQALEEEAEARRLQKKQLEAMSAADYGFDEGDWKESHASNDKSNGSQQVVVEVLPQLQVSAKMTASERIKLLSTRYPEFTPLKSELLHMRTEYSRLSALNQSNGAVRIKLRAAAAYLGALVVYFSLLTSPASQGEADVVALATSQLREHPIMDSLVECRNVWLKVMGLTERTRFIATDVAGVNDGESLDEDEYESISEEDESLIPQPLDASTQRKKDRLLRTEADLDDLNHLLSSSRAAHLARKTRTRPSPSDNNDLGEAAALTSREAADKLKRKKSLRFYASQISQKANKRGAAGRSAGGDDDIPHRERLRDRQARLNAEAEKRGRRGQDAGEDLGGESDEEDRKDARQIRDEGDEYYDYIAARTAKKKGDRAALADAQRLAAEQGGRVVVQEDGVGEDGKRAITYAIEKNKGLTPHRRKELRNPRVKKRMKFEQKKKKLASMKAVYKGGEGRGGYGGELTGIKKGLVKSVKL